MKGIRDHYNTEIHCSLYHCAKAGIYHVGFLNNTPLYSEMPLSEEEQRNCSSTSSISPMEEDSLLSYPSSQSSYLMVSPHQSAPQMTGSAFLDYFPAPQDYGSGPDSHHSLMYTNSQLNGHPFMTSGSSYSATSLSPTSSISSGTFNNFTANTVAANVPNLYLRVPNDCMSYELENTMRQESSPTASYSDGSNGLLPEYKTSPAGSCTPASNGMSAHAATMASHQNRSDNHYSNSKPHKYTNSRDCAHGKKTTYTKGQVRDKPKKRCSNCHSVQSPSWRRSILKPTKGNLLCNACGL